ncbi:MAG: InlB B-repeat-containing protein, partial [Acholeplasmataceae bacterium]
MRKVIFLTFFNVLLVLFLVGCTKASVSNTILFETNGGNPCSPITLDEGDTLILPNDPTKDGYVFEGWFIDSELNILFTIDQLEELQNQTITLYAKWASSDSELTLILKHIYQLSLDSDFFDGTYEEWLETVRGPQGLPGEDGEDGDTPYIGENGNWFIDQTDTGVFAGYYYPDIPTTGEFTFAVNSDGESYYILSYSGLDRYVDIPKYHLGYPVTAIGP